MGPFFLDPEDVTSLSRENLDFIQRTGLPCLEYQFKGHKGSVKKD